MKQFIFLITISLVLFTSCKKDRPEKKSWRETTLPLNGPLQDIQFISNTVGYILGGNSGPGGEYNILYKTIDGGNSWTSKQFPMLENGLLNSLFVVSSNEIYVGANGVHKSIDGGVTWQDIDTAFTKVSNRICKINFKPGFPLIVLKGAEVYQYINNSFTPIFHDPSGTSMKKAQVINNNTIYFTSGSFPNYGVLYKSINAGVTWQNIPINFGFISTHFIDENVGYAFTSYDVYKTINGGQNWAKQNNQQLNGDGDICFANDAEGYFINQGEIYVSTDQGKSWGLDYKKDGITFKKIIVTPDSKIIAIGFNGTILNK